MIAVQIPVLNRPHNAARLLDSLYAASEGGVWPVFICSPGDEAQYRACQETEATILVVPFEAGPGDFARKHNLCFRTFDEFDFVLLAADDLEFEPGWDTKALAVAERTHAGVIGTDDDANPLVKRGKHATHPLVRRSYIEQVGGTWHDGPGVVYHEGYDHQYVDTELVQAAMERGEWAFAHGSVVRHLHPMYPKRGSKRTQMDDTYRKALAEGSADARLYRERVELAKRVRLGHAL